LATLRSAVHALGDGPGRVVRVSAVYETRPLGPSDAPFLNAAVELETTEDPGSLLARLHEIETAHARTRRIRWEARTLDLDLVAMLGAGATALLQRDAAPVLPHPDAHRRDFVLRPLVDLGFDHPLRNGRSVDDLLASLPDRVQTVLARLDDDLRSIGRGVEKSPGQR
jgi:2-amino-4-hydroxy-6-hydroxymethyldihydropteridine diphosphokinase